MFYRYVRMSGQSWSLILPVTGYLRRELILINNLWSLIHTTTRRSESSIALWNGANTFISTASTTIIVLIHAGIYYRIRVPVSWVTAKKSLSGAPFVTLKKSLRERTMLEMCNSKLQQEENCKSQHLQIEMIARRPDQVETQ